MRNPGFKTNPNGTMLLRIAVATLLVVAVSAVEIPAQSHSLGLYGGYALSTGDWKDHRYADGVDQFSPDFTFAMDFAMGLGDNFYLGLNFIYTRLNVDDWEQYVRSQGEELDANARIWVVPVTLKYTAFTDAKNALSVEGGIGLGFGSSQESYLGTTYNYDFLKGTGFVWAAGLDYGYKLNRSLALSLRYNLVLIPGGVQYADNIEHNIVAMPLLAGLRYSF